MASRGLTLEVSSLKADNARLAQEAVAAASGTAALRASLQAAEREAAQVRH